MIRIHEVKKGMIFWEYDMGRYMQYEALTDATQVDEPGRKGWTLKGKCTGLTGTAPMADSDGVVTFFENPEFKAYYLKLYRDEEIVRYPM